ncbi:S1C family serine protease [Salinibacillus xinjiangensis]|uniref:PDZ domain-containing protein n=1 Tax=Salinibacillus xinjiangensis TaxID=1229268 RepID=A0A6G1XAC9_9BACI|nr:trypsin-like peptidase domain-containing protein [Salinibacillus xinjiangensis]MRG87865.1 PDZ domain-containing protein [Salinibacillus xinjiangensis]
MEEQEQKTEVKNEKSSTLKRFLTTLSAGVIGSVLTLAAVPQMDFLYNDIQDANKQEEVSQTAREESASTVNVDQVSAESTSIADVVDQSSEAIVGVVNKQKQTSNPFRQPSGEIQKGTGSGVIYKVTEDAAYIVTNHHVIAGANEIEVSLHDGEVVKAELVGTDSLTDIAVLKLEGDYDITPLKFGDSSNLRPGQQVIAIGNPLGLELSRTVTQGIVSAVNRTITVPTSAGKWEVEVIQTDAAINPGNSGGALINTSGQLVGINSMKISENGVEGLGFAIPSNDVSQIVEEISKNGQVVRPYIGVGLAGLDEIHPYYRSKLSGDIKEGAMVVSVDEDSAAGKAGIQEEDIIVAINDKKIKNADDIRHYLYTELSVGDEVTIEFYRDGELQSVDLTLTSNEKQ